jgi:iron complex outermembrane receptor protein
MLSRSCRSGWVSLVAVVVYTSTSIAQQNVTPTQNAGLNSSPSPADDSAGLMEIVVTAQKREQRLQDIGMSIQAFSGSDLADRGITSTQDLDKVVAGFTFAQTPTSTPVYTLRGVGYFEESMSASPAVSVYVDEVPLPFPLMGLGADLDMQRVEVLKGPQGTLFGENSTGGAINYIANKPTQTLEYGGTVSYGRFGALESDAFISGPLTETLSARFAIKTEQGGAWQKAYTFTGSLGNKDLDMGRLLLDWAPTPGFSAELNINGWVDRGDTQAPQLAYIQSQNGETPHSYLVNYPRPPRNDQAADWTQGYTRKDNNFGQAALRLDYDLTPALKVTSLSNYEHYNQHQGNDGDGLTYSDIDYITRGDIATVSQELRLTGQSEQFHYVVGGNFEKDDTYENEINNISSTTNDPLFGIFPYTYVGNYSDQPIKTYAGFANLEYHPIESLTLHAGARYTDTKRSDTSCMFDVDGGIAAGFTFAENLLKNGVASFPPYPPNVVVIPKGGCYGFVSPTKPTPGTFYGKLDQDNVSWRVGTDWKPDEATLLYGSASKGFKSGSFPVITGAGNYEFTPVTQESVMAYEVGSKSNLFNNRLQVNTAAFYYFYLDKQFRGKYPDPVFGLLEKLVNVPRSDIRGAELEVRWAPFRSLNLSASASYLDTRVLQYVNYGTNSLTPADTVNFAGSPFPFTPKWQFVSDGEYDWSLSHSYLGFFGASLTYHSRTNGQFGDYPQVAIPSYYVTNLRAGVKTSDDRWRIWLYGTNVTDRYYWTSVYQQSDVIVRYMGQPAEWGISASYRFR